jgi:hypothetical protein
VGRSTADSIVHAGQENVPDVVAEPYPRTGVAGKPRGRTCCWNCRTAIS